MMMKQNSEIEPVEGVSLKELLKNVRPATPLERVSGLMERFHDEEEIEVSMPASEVADDRSFRIFPLARRVIEILDSDPDPVARIGALRLVLCVPRFREAKRK